MTDQFDTLWNEALEAMQPEVSSGNFVSFFKPTRLLSLENDVATIAAPSAMVIEMLKRKYQDVIKKALDKKTQKDMRVMFVAKAAQRKTTIDKEEPPLFATTQQESKPISIGHLPRVRPDFTFETLAVSDSNRLAFESAKTVVKNLGNSYNPLFIYGPVGVGKTHLMQAIANAVYQKSPDNKIIYITSEEFTNEVVEAIRSNDTARMKRRFRSVVLLIIDDVQFIAGKDKVQEELFHTFNILIDAGGQIVLSSDRPPSEIKKLEARLSSRFGGGLTVDVESPDFEMRTAIVLKKSEKFGYTLPIEAAKIIAEKAQDVRSLEGALLRVITKAQDLKTDITEELTKKVIFGKEDKQPHNLHAEDVITVACEYYQIKPTLLKGPKRDASLVKARQVTMFLLYKELGLTLVEIGNILGGRDHTTVMYGVEKIEKLVTSNPHLSGEIMGITKSLRG